MTTEEGTIVAPNPLATLQPKSEVKGKVVKIELYGAFVDVGVGTDGLLHISQISTDRIKNVNDKLSVGDEITVWVRQVDVEQKRIDLTMIKPSALDWTEIAVGQKHTGKVIRIEKFGAFVDIGAERPGMVHVSELSNNYINSPQDVVKVGQEIEVKVIKVSSKKKQIDLSVKALEEKIEIPKNLEEDTDISKLPTAMELALRSAMEGTDMAAQLPIKSKKKQDVRSEKRRQEQSEALARAMRAK
jgi:small subunit ribosomal protein S1